MTDAAMIGDPAAMRATANALLGRAEVIAGSLAGVVTSLDAATFEGGAARRLRSATSATQAQVAAAAAELRDIAAALLADAADVERQNAEAKAEADAQAAADAKALVETKTANEPAAPTAGAAGAA